jgi:hypothetical protein
MLPSCFETRRFAPLLSMRGFFPPLTPHGEELGEAKRLEPRGVRNAFDQPYSAPIKKIAITSTKPSTKHSERRVPLPAR